MPSSIRGDDNFDSSTGQVVQLYNGGYAGNTTVTVSESLDNFTQLVFVINNSARSVVGAGVDSHETTLVEIFKTSGMYCFKHYSAGWYGCKITYVNSTQLTVADVSSAYGIYGIYEIWGVR